MKTSNLLVILSDEHTSTVMGCAGHPVAITPNLDALAARGTRFENAYVPCPICVPARASFATGRYVHQVRKWDNAMPYIGEPRGWGHALQDQGTRVESIGKLHYRYADDPAGFDVEHIPMNVVNGTGMVWGSVRREDQRKARPSRMLGEYIGPGDSKYTRYDTGIVQRTEDWLADAARRGDDRPWCLYVGFVAPHFPLVVPQAWLDLYPEDRLPPDKLSPRDGFVPHPWVAKQSDSLSGDGAFHDEAERIMARRCYFGLCSFLDDNIGKVLSALDANGFGENTTVIYSSDHGENMGVRGLWGKSNMYEEAVAAPLIMAPPKGAPAEGRVCRTPVNLIDISETIIDHFGATLEGERPGRSLYRIASEPEDRERVVFSEYHAVGAVRGCYMIRKGRWKYICYMGFEPELFDLDSDPEETTSVADRPENADILADLHAELCKVCDPEATEALAFGDQNAMIESYGGIEAALELGAPGATPAPEV